MRMFFRMPLGSCTLFLPAVVLIGCGSAAGMKDAPEPSSVAAEPTEVKVKVDNFTYDPPRLTVKVGTKVTWTNRDDVPHTVTSAVKPRLLESPTLDTDDSFSHIFAQPGTYFYYCTLHPRMTGTVIVK